MANLNILDSLNPEQRAAAATHTGPVLVLAGAGTGKTRVITYRIAGMIACGIPPEQILGMTFTNKAAREMRERLAMLVAPDMAKAVTLGTFHAFCVKVLRREIHRINYLPNFTIADTSDQQGLLKQAAAALGLNQEHFPYDEAAAMIGRWKNRLLFPHEVRDTVEFDFEITTSQIYEEYQHMLAMQNMVDFDDMLLLVHQILTDFPEVLKKYQETYRYILVDEYQDTNNAQFTLLNMLVGPNRNLCVVGDDDQSIYSWRGADIENILNFTDTYPEAKVVKLEQNYRSTRRILSAANTVIASNAKRHPKALWSKEDEGEAVTVVTTASGEKEGDFIADYILQEMGENSERKYKDFAILYRSNHLSRQIEQTLRQCNIPYRLVGGQEFYKRKEIKDAVSYLRLIINPAENQSLLRILATPPRGLGDKAVNLLKQIHVKAHTPMVKILGQSEFLTGTGGKGAISAKELFDTFEQFRKEFDEPGQLARKITAFLSQCGYLDGLQRMYKNTEEALKRRENVDEFINAVAIFEKNADHKVTLMEYLESFALLEENDRTAEDEENNSDAVTLSTVHASKGLEFPIVFTIGMDANIFPHERALAEGSVDEELRLFYVAITRAREKLLLTHANTRMQRGFSHIQIASPFLRLLPEDEICATTPDEIIKVMSKDDMNAAFANIFKILNQ